MLQPLCEPCVLSKAETLRTHAWEMRNTTLNNGCINNVFDTVSELRLAAHPHNLSYQRLQRGLLHHQALHLAVPKGTIPYHPAVWIELFYVETSTAISPRR